MTLQELLGKLREEHLGKDALENLRDEMAHLFSLYQLEMARIKKVKAIYWVARKQTHIEGKHPTNAEVDHLWDITKSGQREIELKYESAALKEELSAIKHRIYSTY